PTAAEILAYREHVDNAMEALLKTNNSTELLELVEIGLQHEQQHQELLLTDIKYILGNNPFCPEYTSTFRETPGSGPAKADWIKIKGGEFTIGANGAGFSFDNETPQHRTNVDDFEISNRLVTNEEYLAFINDGGYSNPEHWLSDGWAWV